MKRIPSGYQSHGRGETTLVVVVVISVTLRSYLCSLSAKICGLIVCLQDYFLHLYSYYFKAIGFHFVLYLSGYRLFFFFLFNIVSVVVVDCFPVLLFHRISTTFYGERWVSRSECYWPWWWCWCYRLNAIGVLDATGILPLKIQTALFNMMLVRHFTSYLILVMYINL